mmetsp:Transcript_8534/g.22806  ORF Transcript_8534/g.22806 Transcript_8534/m.22806 type:complete len:84 (-) Transcript_8534:1977-2228(-)
MRCGISHRQTGGGRSEQRVVARAKRTALAPSPPAHLFGCTYTGTSVHMRISLSFFYFYFDFKYAFTHAQLEWGEVKQESRVDE